MTRINVTGDVVLQAIVARLRSKLQLDDRNCYEVADADDLPRIPISGDYWVTVANGDGEFEQGEQDQTQLSETTEAIVTGYTRIQLDSTDHAGSLLHDPSRGLLEIKRRLLAAIVPTSGTAASDGTDDLVDESGNTFLRQTINVIRSSPPTVGEYGDARGGLKIGRIQLVIRLEFDWDLTGGIT